MDDGDQKSLECYVSSFYGLKESNFNTMLPL
jgi:hypothetical protein